MGYEYHNIRYEIKKYISLKILHDLLLSHFSKAERNHVVLNYKIHLLRALIKLVFRTINMTHTEVENGSKLTNIKLGTRLFLFVVNETSVIPFFHIYGGCW